MKNSTLTIGSTVNYTNGNPTIHTGIIKAERFHKLHNETQYYVNNEWIYAEQIK